MRRFVFRPEALKSICVVPVTARDCMSASSEIRRPALSMRALAFVVRAFGPRRSHSTSRRTTFSSDSRCLF